MGNTHAVVPMRAIGGPHKGSCCRKEMLVMPECGCCRGTAGGLGVVALWWGLPGGLRAAWAWISVEGRFCPLIG